MTALEAYKLSTVQIFYVDLLKRIRQSKINSILQGHTVPHLKDLTHICSETESQALVRLLT